MPGDSAALTFQQGPSCSCNFLLLPGDSGAALHKDEQLLKQHILSQNVLGGWLQRAGRKRTAWSCLGPAWSPTLALLEDVFQGGNTSRGNVLIFEL